MNESMEDLIKAARRSAGCDEEICQDLSRRFERHIALRFQMLEEEIRNLRMELTDQRMKDAS